MKKIFGLTFFIFFLSLSSVYAQQGSSGGGPSLGHGAFSIGSSHEIQAFRELIDRSRFESSLLIQIDESEVEALTTVDGDYARLDDLKDGFVSFDGIHIKEKSVFFEPLKVLNSVRSAILHDGREVKIFRLSKND